MAERGYYPAPGVRGDIQVKDVIRVGGIIVLHSRFLVTNVFTTDVTSTGDCTLLWKKLS